MTGGESAPLFVYGSLLVDEVLLAVLGRLPQRRPARAVGWRRAALRGRAYPGLVAGTAAVDGMVLTDLTDAERDLLDAWEGPAYDRREVRLADGTTATTYVWVDDALALAADWDVEAFRRGGLAPFLTETASWVAERQR